MHKQIINIKETRRFSNFVVYVTILLFSTFSVNALIDNDLSNNRKNISINVINGYNLSVMFVKIDNPSNFNSYVENAVELLEDIYPVKDNGIIKSIYSININSTQFLNSVGINLPIADDGTSKRASKELVRFLDRLGKSSNVDKVVGVAPIGFMKEILNISGIGYTYSYLSSGVLVESGFRDVVVHEISHTRAFILCDEYNDTVWKNQNDDRLLFGFIGSGCPNGDKNNDDILDNECLGAGCPTSTFGKLINQPSVSEVNLNNIMGNEVYPNVWISNDSYNAVIDGFERGVLGKTLQKIIMYTGTYFKNGTVTVDTAYVIEDAFAISKEEVIPGNISINLTDTNNNVIFSVNFTPIFSIDGKNISGNLETNFSYFSFSLPYNTTLKKIQFIDKGNISNQKNVTPNTPTINITTQLQNQVFDKSFTITWNASDLDNDTIQYAILISSDNSNTFSTLEIDYPNKSLTINSTNFINSNKYKIKILATDGINTGNDTSDTFSIYHDQNKFLIKNSTGGNIAWVGDLGNIVLKGIGEENSNYQRTENSVFVIRNNGEDVLIIENNGSVYIDGELFENQAVIPINIDRNEFRFRWNGEFKTNINESGYLFTKGTLTQNGNP